MCSTSATNTESRMSVIPPGKKNSMSRLQRKCVVASFTAHALLLALLVVGSAFMKSPPKSEPVHFVKIFRDSKVTDDETQGGGNPNVPSNVTPQQPAQPPVQPPLQPLVQEPPTKIETPPTPKVERIETPPPKKDPIKKPPKKEPKHETPKITENPKTTVPKDTPKPPKHEIEVSLDVKKPTVDPVAERLKAEKARAAKEERIRQEKERQAQERARQDAIDQANREYKKTLEALGNIVGKVD